MSCRNVDRPELCQISLYDFQKFLQMDQKVRREKQGCVVFKNAAFCVVDFMTAMPVAGVVGLRSDPRQGFPRELHEERSAAGAHAAAGRGETSRQIKPTYRIYRLKKKV